MGTISAFLAQQIGGSLLCKLILQPPRPHHCQRPPHKTELTTGPEQSKLALNTDHIQQPLLPLHLCR